MSNQIIEALRNTKIGQERLSPFQIKAQMKALKGLITVAHQQLVVNQIDRDVSLDSSKEQHRFDAWFFIPDLNGVMKITSVGLPDAQDTNGLFLSIHNRNEQGEQEEFVGLETAKVPEVVTKQEALWLSRYTPGQLLQIAELVRTANSITPESYQNWFKEPQIPAGLEM